jgi:hypothetical protein
MAAVVYDIEHKDPLLCRCGKRVPDDVVFAWKLIV